MRESSLPNSRNITRHELPNGLVLLVRENHAVPTVEIEGTVAVGSVHEMMRDAGLAALTARMLRRGTKHHPFEALNEVLESVGASIEVSAGRRGTSVHGTALSEDVSLLMTLLAEVLREPAIPADQFRIVQQQTLAQLQEQLNDTQSMASLTFRTLLYPFGHPNARNILGDPQSVSRLRPLDVAQFYALNFTPRGAHLVVVGDVEASEVIALAEEAFGGWRGGDATQPDLPEVLPPGEVRQQKVVMPDKTQSDIVLGWLGVRRLDPDWMAVNVANTLLGRFGMGGRLGDSVREKQGLAYYVYSSAEAGMDAGPWLAAAGVAPQAVDQTVRSILAEIKRLQDEPVPAEELADTQAYITGLLPLQLETNAGVANVISNMEWYKLGLDYLLGYSDAVWQVTPADVQRVAQQYLDPEVYVLATAGPVPPAGV